MPNTTLDFLVVDRETNDPIEDALLYMIYDAPDGRIFKKGPFYTNKEGIGTVKVEKERIWVSASYLYFAGDIIRKVQATATGYEPSSFIRDYEFSNSNKEQPLTFKLTPFRNKFGSVLVLSQYNENNDIMLDLQIIDGPRSDEKISIAIMKEDEEIDYTNKKFYLRKPLENILESFEKRRVLAINFPVYFREGFPDEEYDPE